MYDSEKAHAAQVALCKQKGWPHFAPVRICWACKRDIYQPRTRIRTDYDGKEREVTSGISVEEASTTLVTGCPHCNRTYCD